MNEWKWKYLSLFVKRTVAGRRDLHHADDWGRTKKLSHNLFPATTVVCCCLRVFFCIVSVLMFRDVSSRFFYVVTFAPIFGVRLHDNYVVLGEMSY